MSNNKDRVYLKGSAKESANGIFINLSLSKAQLNELPTQVSKKGEEFIAISIAKRKDGADQYGNTHTMYLNDFQPEPQSTPKSAKKKVAKGQDEDMDDLPF